MIDISIADSSSDEDEEAIQAEMKRRCLRFEREEFLKVSFLHEYYMYPRVMAFCSCCVHQATHSDDADDDLDKSILQKVSSCQPSRF